MKLSLSLLLIFCINFFFGQITSSQNQTVQIQEGPMILKNGGEIFSDIKFQRYEDHFYFKNKGVLFKIHKDSVQTIEGVILKIKSDKVSYYLNKFASESQTGIALQIIGTSLGIALSFTELSPFIIFTIPPAISITGFVIWASSYRHLKKYRLIAEAQDYFKKQD